MPVTVLEIRDVPFSRRHLVMQLYKSHKQVPNLVFLNDQRQHLSAWQRERPLAGVMITPITHHVDSLFANAVTYSTLSSFHYLFQELLHRFQSRRKRNSCLFLELDVDQSNEQEHLLKRYGFQRYQERCVVHLSSEEILIKDEQLWSVRLTSFATYEHWLTYRNEQFERLPYPNKLTYEQLVAEEHRQQDFYLIYHEQTVVGTLRVRYTRKRFVIEEIATSLPTQSCLQLLQYAQTHFHRQNIRQIALHISKSQLNIVEALSQLEGIRVLTTHRTWCLPSPVTLFLT